MNPHFDTVVIGGGQGGSLARMLAEGGQRVALIEKRFIGGSCTNVGCTPTKAHIAAAKAAHMVRVAGEFGVQAHLERVDLRVVAARTRRIVEEFRDESEKQLLQTKGLELIYGQGRFVDGGFVEVELRHGGTRMLGAGAFVVAVGTRAEVPDVKGLRGVPFLTHVEALQLEEVPSDLLILGGGYIACEFAQMFARFGAKVTLVQNAEQLLAHEDADVAEAVADVLRASGIEIVLGCEAETFQKSLGGIEATWDGVGREFSHVLVATGHKPQTSELGLESVGVKQIESGYIQTDEYLKTSNPKVYALGDCKGGAAFTHTAYDDARILRDGLLWDQWRSIEERPVPYTVFLDPQLGRIGLSENEARKAGKQFDVARIEMKEIARGVETGESQGFWKVLVERGSNLILGGAFLSGQGGETMAVVEMAMMGKMPYTALRDAVFAHPTWAESLNNLFLGFDRQTKNTEHDGAEKGERCHYGSAFGG